MVVVGRRSGGSLGRVEAQERVQLLALRAVLGLRGLRLLRALFDALLEL